ncbi:MAG: hypothetical protein PUA81_05330 [Oscillospiraceae bacterium]|nr:hypothetical protein [Oscillospiraceae bacterium]
MNYYTDRNFSCGKYREFENARTISIVGADIAEKGRIIEAVGEIFAESKPDFYFSPCDRELPYAVYLPDRNILVTGGYIKKAEEKITSRTYDISSVIGLKAAPAEEIVGYTMNQSRSYMQKYLDLLGMTDYLLREYVRNGSELLYQDRAEAYAARKISSMLEKRPVSGTAIHRSVSAITCEGYRFVKLPPETEVIRLSDRLLAAEQCFVKTAAAVACKLGYDVILSGAVDLIHSPIHLYIPGASLLFISESPLLPERFPECKKISLERFYSRGLTASREHYSDFFGEYIRRMFSESALYARICMDIRSQGRKLLAPFISEQSVSVLAAEIIQSLQ